MNTILLLGAGFSRNWGGWLSSEAFEYLLGCSQLNSELRSLLWKHKRTGGFEAALAELQNNHVNSGNKTPEPSLQILQNAILEMFRDMDDAFEGVPFEFQNYSEYQIRNFLVRFDSIFTLNQDLLLERHYLNGNVELSANKRWDGWQIPGMKINNPHPSGLLNPSLGKWSPDTPPFKVGNRLQPYFKLHGSSNWIDVGAEELLVMGGDKSSIIGRNPVLKWYSKLFREYISQPNTRLMVVGYGFGDDHINTIIRDGVKTENLRIFVIDPLGVDVIDKNRFAAIYTPDQLAKDLWPYVIGSSQRSLREIFGADLAEHNKVMRFFA